MPEQITIKAGKKLRIEAHVYGKPNPVCKWKKGEEAYYPMNDEKNSELFNKYVELSKKEDKVLFGGRLGMYRYFDMWQVIDEALKLVNRLK